MVTANRFHLMILICQTIGITNINSIPTIAATYGPTGSTIAFLLIYIFLGIPLIYMELIIGQFTGRDCVDIWKIRPFLSHIGYTQILWQVIILIYNHVFLSFALHYFLISFENPIPYYKCGAWSTNDCNMLFTNFTVNEDCLKMQGTEKYCELLYTTFPEYQYWKYNLLHLTTKDHLNVAWRVCLASGLISIFLYLSCFRRKSSLKWVVSCLPIYPILAFIPIMMGSMLQKGLVTNFEDALDLDFEDFSKKFRLANIIQQVVFNLGIGTGININFASTSSFRYNCFSNGVIAVVVSAVFSVLVICTIVMMSCPYGYHFGISSGMILKLPMSLVFEKVPRLLAQYEQKLVWIFLIYSCYVTVGLCAHVMVLHNLLETIITRIRKVSNYPGLTTFVFVAILFLVTLPLVSNFGIVYALAFRRYVTLLSTFVAFIECLVFVIFYGLHRLSEDVHFMLGIQPSVYIKAAWLIAVGFLGYAFWSEITYYYINYLVNSIIIDIAGISVLLFICGTIILCCIIKLLVATCQKRFIIMLSLDSKWGPKSQVLRRSRGMFSAQAMTKEYMYRQYHLQAGIVSRQMKCNKRNFKAFEDQQYS